VIRHLPDDRDRIAQGMNDAVVHRILAAALDLQAALGLIGEHQDASKIYHGIDELDQAIRDIRDTTFGLRYAIRGHFRARRTGGKPPGTSPDFMAIL
jgi:signal transduction histidine kinase